MDITHKLALRLKLWNVSGQVMHHVALLKKALDLQGIRSQVVKGYCVIEESKEACEHYWINIPDPDGGPGLNLDVAFMVATLKNRELMALHPVLLETLPPGLTRSDSAEILIREENRRLYDLFVSDPRAFWREAPKDVVSFPVK